MIHSEVLKQFEIIRQATSINADLFNMRRQIGVVAPGGHTYLIVFECDPLHDIAVLADPETQMVAIIRGGAFVKNTL
ncbi:MAG: hypothetical protein HYR63_17185 [Proteobacteria bacterium]|nr:hypothetical protein [Pseudomonadota bacterium]